MIRAFVGLALPGEVARALVAAQAGLPQGRPVPPENFHVTLAFLGEHPEPVIEDAHYALAAIRAAPFPVEIRGAGLFGGARPTALYARIEPSPPLGHLRDKVATAIRGAGIPLAREKFLPHVTLARFGQGLAGEAAAELHVFVATRIMLAAGPFEAAAFVLWRSRLGRLGPSYEEMADYPLAG